MRLTRRQRVGTLALVVLALALAFGTPVHVSPGNGSLRCTDSIVTEGFHYSDNSEGLARACTRAGRSRLLQGVVAALAALALGLAGATTAAIRRPVRIVAALVLLISCLGIVGNLMG